MGSSSKSEGIYEHTLDRAVEHVAELENQCNQLIDSNARLREDVERKEKLIGRLELQLSQAQGALRSSENVAASRMQTITRLTLCSEEVHTFDASNQVSLVLSALTEGRKSGQLCDVRAKWDHNEQAVGITLCVVPKSLTNGGGKSLAGDAHVTRASTVAESQREEP